MGEEEGEEDYGALIYRESQLRKAEAAAVAAKSTKKRKKNSSVDVSSTRRRSRASSAVRSKSSVNAAHMTNASKRKRESSTEVEGPAPRKVSRKQYKKKCSADGCTNQVQKGGLCKRHGAKTKRCSVEGCTTFAKKGGVCYRHSAYNKPTDETTASCLGSEFDKTTLTHPNQRTPAPSTSQGSVPEQVAVCVVIANNHVEV